MPDRTITIAATFTAEPVEGPLSYLLAGLQQTAGIEFGPYNQVFQQLLDPISLLRTNRAGVKVILLRLEDWANAETLADGERVFNQQTVDNMWRATDDFVAAIADAQLDPGSPYLVILCPASAVALAVPDAQKALIELEDHLLNELGQQGVDGVSSAMLLELYPVIDYDDRRGNALAHIPYTSAGFAAIGAMIARRVYRLLNAEHKVIVLDCDQTLWKGVCGEDGPMGLELDAPRRFLQEFMVEKHDAGQLLCICSRNNEEDVVEVFKCRTEMPLKREHITSWRINWGPKSENLRSLARELNLGIESFIFVDDDPAVCMEVQTNCPEVLTLLLPNNPADIPRFLKHVWAFDTVARTRVDAGRTRLYKENAEREQLRSSVSSLGEFLAGLGLQIEISEVTPENLPRVSQLTQRTNQFNFTTIRRTETEVQQLCQSGRLECLTASVRDRFGDYGLVGVVMFEQKAKVLDVDTFLLSCRALGRGVEHKLLAHLGAIAEARGLDYVDVWYAETQKNKPALEFVSQLKVSETRDDERGRCFRIAGAAASTLNFVGNNQSAKGRQEFEQAAGKPLSTATPGQAFLHRIANDYFGAEQIVAAVTAESERLRPATEIAFIAPRDEVETKLKDLWESILHVQPIGVEDNFFELGGDSFLGVRLFVEIETRFCRSLPLVTLLSAPTIRQLSEILREERKDIPFSCLVPLQPEGRRPPLYCIHAAGGNVLFYRDLANHLGKDQPLYGLQSRGMDKNQTNHDCVEDMAEYYLTEIRAFQPAGPYYLAGSSFGGLVAFEMARQLETAGQAVALLALFDTYGPGYPRLMPKSSATVTRAAYWNERARTMLESARLLAPKERLAFVVSKTQKIKRKLTRKLAWRKNEFAVKYAARMGRELPRDMQRNHKAIEQALHSYQPQIYGGRLTLFRATRQPAGIVADPALGWQDLVRGGLDIYEVPGVHGAVTVDPYARFLAEKLKPCLADAQRSDNRGAAPEAKGRDNQVPGSLTDGERGQRRAGMSEPTLNVTKASVIAF